MISPEYIILLIVVMVAVFRQSKFWVCASMFLMLLLAVCRGKTVGTDYLGYYDDFCLIHDISNSSKLIYHNFEVGFIALIYWYKKITDNYLLFGSLIFLPFFFGCLKFMKVSKVNIAYGLFIFYTYGFYFSSYNIMRQMMCIGLILFFINWLYRKKYLHFAIMVIVFSILFHRSSVVMLLLIPIHYYACKVETINKKLLYIITIASYALYYLGANLFVGIFSSIVSFVGLSSYGEGYLRTDSEGGNTVSLMYTLLALIIIFCKNPRNVRFPLFAFIAYILIFNILNIIPTFASRAAWGLFFFAIVLIPQMLADKGTLHRKLFFAAAMTFGLGYFFYAYYINNFGEINPYIWSI